MTIEETLNKTYKDTGAYKVPDGYFDMLQDRIMSQIPEEVKESDVVSVEPVAKRSRIVLMRRYVAAASVAAAVVVAGILGYNYLAHDESEMTIAEATDSQELMTDSYTQECLDYAMVNNQEMYHYLAEQ